MHFIFKVLEKNNNEYTVIINKENILEIPLDNISKKLIYSNLDLPKDTLLYSLSSVKSDNKVTLNKYLLLSFPQETVQKTTRTEVLSREIIELILDSTRYPIHLIAL